MVSDGEIEITENEIIYPKRGLSILKEKTALELEPLTKDNIEGPSCVIPEPKVGLRFGREIKKIKDKLNDNYFLITKDIVEKLISNNNFADINRNEEVILSTFFLPRSNSKIILSTIAEEKADHSGRYTSYEEFIDILSNGNFHSIELDNKDRLKGDILIGRYI